MKRQLTNDEIQNILSQLDQYLSDLKVRWNQENPGNKSWWAISSDYLISSTTFLINIVDELVIFIENVNLNGINLSGTDKKAAVLAIVSKMFDYIVTQECPIWLKPLVPTIKNIVVNIIISNLVDYIISKYNAGFWNLEGATNAQKN